jgi:hypothetical protein
MVTSEPMNELVELVGIALVVLCAEGAHAAELWKPHAPPVLRNNPMQASE